MMSSMPSSSAVPPHRMHPGPAAEVSHQRQAQGHYEPVELVHLDVYGPFTTVISADYCYHI